MTNDVLRVSFFGFEMTNVLRQAQDDKSKLETGNSGEKANELKTKRFIK